MATTIVVKGGVLFDKATGRVFEGDLTAVAIDAEPNT